MLLGSTVASAEPLTLEAARRDLALDDVHARGFHMQGFAQLAGAAADKAEADAALGGELRVVGPRCDYVRAGGQARVGWNRGAQASAEQWASVCLPLFVTVMEFGHHLEWDVRPSLLAPLRLRAGTNRRETASFHWQPLRMNAHRFMGGLVDPSAPPVARPKYLPNLAPPPPGDIVIFEVWTDWEFLWSATTPLSTRQTVDSTPVRYVRDHEAAWGERRDFAVDVFQAGGEFSQPEGVDEKGAANVRLWLAKIENLKLGPVYASAGFGGAAPSAGDYVAQYEREIDLIVPRALLSVETGGSEMHGYLRATHDASVVADGFVTVDSRLASGVGFVGEHSKVSVEGTLARTKLYVPRAMTSTAATGGVSLSAARSLSKHLQATLMVDVARSFYAPSVTAADFAPRWGMQVFGALQATAGR